jgi:hypothetical protein
MATAQILKVTHTVDDRVRRVDDRVAGMNDRVRAIDDKVAGVVAGEQTIFTQCLNKLLTLIHLDGKEVKFAVQQAVDSIDQVKGSSSLNLIIADCPSLRVLPGTQLRESIYRWLSPPDPSTNHNIACDTYHKRAATWFFQGSTYKEWVSTGSLLWIHGKRASLSKILTNAPDGRGFVAGSGKSVLRFVIHELFSSKCYLCLSVRPSSRTLGPCAMLDEHR